MTKPDLVLIPTYNERENILKLVPAIFAREPDLLVVVIDDSSPDGTASAVESLQERYPNLSLYRRPQKNGLGAAYIEAITWLLTRSDWRAIITMDADGSHDPKYLAPIRSLLADHDLVIGSRYVAGGGVVNWGWHRRLISRFGNGYARIFARLGVRDLTAGFMGIRREVLSQVALNQIGASGFSFLIELKYFLIKKAGARWQELPIIFPDRTIGQTKFSPQIFIEGLIVPWRLLGK